MRGGFFKTWAQVSMGLLVCLVVVFLFFIFTR
jgi:hypothetical protein